jgi:hypothetical protein
VNRANQQIRQKLMTQQPSNLNELLVGRKINQEFLSQLEITRDDKFPLPGAITKNYGDSRINLVSNIAKPSDETVLCEHLATIRHKGTGRLFIVYRDTVDALFMESQDVIKYPKWLMEDPRKQNERSIRINEMLRAPSDKYDRDWLGGDLDDQTYDTLAYFLYLQVAK